MNASIRNIVAVLAGVTAGVILMNSIESFSPYQPPPGITYTSGEPPYLQWVRDLPTNAWVIILGSMLAASLVGGLVTNIVTPRAVYPPLVTGFVILFFAIVKYMAFASPAWVTYVSCIGCILFGWIGGRLSRFFEKKQPA